MKTYIVTVTPKHRAYAGSWSAGAYEVEIFAKDRNDAIRQARAGYEDSRVNPATFTAKVKKAEPAVNPGFCCQICGAGFDFGCRCPD